jgi:hypothetical protein
MMPHLYLWPDELRQEAIRLGYFFVATEREFRMIRPDFTIALRISRYDS